MKPLRSDAREIARTLGVLYQAGDVVEMRIPKTERDGTVSGYFSDHAALARQLAARNGAAAVYLTLNPVVPSLLARSANRVRTRARTTTSDHDIAARRWLLVDCDPARPAEISSCDPEHEAAIARARTIRFELGEEGWPEPILADSGNGAHLVYSIDLPNDQPSTKLVEDVLKALAARFNDAAVKVDETVFNAGRIVKAYGTVACKGDNLPERPHRLSRILDAPSRLEPVSRDLLEELAGRMAPPPAGPPRGTQFDIDAFLARHLQARAPVAREGGRKWVLEKCPFDPGHQAPDSAIFERADGSLGFKCFHASCSGKGWKDVRELFEGPRPRANASKSSAPASEESKKDRAHRPTSPDAGSLITRCLSDIESKPVSWLWHGRIPRGKLTIIAGNPGLGKSQITASIAAIVTAGGHWPVDGTRSTAGNILFLTAEDDAADTLRPRLEAAGADLSRIHIIEGVNAGYTGDGTRRNRVFSLEQDIPCLSEKLAEIGEVAAIIIDPISAYLGDTDSHKNAEVRGLLTPLSELAAQHEAAIIGVSHLNKSGGAEAMMRVSGSLAFIAASRAAYLVARDPNDKARRFFLPLKNNLAPDAAGLAYRIEGKTVESKAGPLETSAIAWATDPVTVTADEVMQTEPPKDKSAMDIAIDWLRGALADGSLPAAEVIAKAGADDIAEKTLRRAAKALGIKPRKLAMGAGWAWSLPSKMAKTGEDAQVLNVDTFGGLGHLRDAEDVEEVEL